VTDEASEVLHNEAASRFELRVQGQVAFAQYHLVDGVMWITHTETPPPLQGRGLAARRGGRRGRGRRRRSERSL
jgi:hypothetical protein